MDLEKTVKESHPPLLKVGGIVPYCNDPHGKLFQNYQENLPATIIDKTSLELIELEALFDALNHTETFVGEATLLTSLSQPLTSVELIRAKQDSLREIAADDALRQRLEDFVQAYKRGDMKEERKWLDKAWNIFRYGRGYKGENALFQFLNEQFRMEHSETRAKYERFCAMKKTGRTIGEAATKILSEAQTPYLGSLINKMKSWEGAPTSDMMNSTSYRSLRGPLMGREAKFYTPRLPFRPTYATLLTWWPTIVVGAGIAAGKYEWDYPVDPDLSGQLLPITFLYNFLWATSKKLEDTNFMTKLARKAKREESFNHMIGSIGRVDELLSFHKYAKAVSYDTCLPDMGEGEKHTFVAEDLRSPILVKTLEEEVVGNSISLEGCNVTCLTGPNSVGKTTLLKSIFQNQSIGQAGGYVTASKAKMSVADYIAYQYYSPDKLDEEHGDFGVNMERTKEIFERATPRSLVGLNTLASGTTHEEELEHSDNVLRGFNVKGNNTLLVTHNHALANHLKAQGIGQFLMGEYKEGKYTRKFVPGISKNSGSHIVAEKIGFTEKHIEAHLREQGYLREPSLYKVS